MLSTMASNISMDIISIAIVLIVIGFLLWAVNKWIPMQSTIKQILNGAVVVLTVLWLLEVTLAGHIHQHFHSIIYW